MNIASGFLIRQIGNRHSAIHPSSFIIGVDLKMDSEDRHALVSLVSFKAVAGIADNADEADDDDDEGFFSSVKRGVYGQVSGC